MYVVMLSLRVVGGVDVLSTMEKVETDSKDTPLEEIRIDKTVVFVDPFRGSRPAGVQRGRPHARRLGLGQNFQALRLLKGA